MTEIKDFIDWCAEAKVELPVPVDAIKETPESKLATSENRARTGCKEGLYPPQYFAGQYPDLWKIPVAADAMYYQKYKK